jgi:hypothetical protein
MHCPLIIRSPDDTRASSHEATKGRSRGRHIILRKVRAPTSRVTSMEAMRADERREVGDGGTATSTSRMVGGIERA